MLALSLLFVVKVAFAAVFPATISPNEEAWPFRTTPACPVPLTGFAPLAVSCTSADLRHKKWHPRDHKTTEPYSTPAAASIRSACVPNSESANRTWKVRSRSVLFTQHCHHCTVQTNNPEQERPVGDVRRATSL